MTDSSSPICIEQHLLLPTISALNYQKFTSTNSTDLALYACHSFLTLSLVEIYIYFHMEPCSMHVPGKVSFRQNILINFIRDNKEIADMDQSCFFCCKEGYSLEKSFGLDYFECVYTNHSCNQHTNVYERQYCYEYMD
jgi:hypothetical protein